MYTKDVVINKYANHIVERKMFMKQQKFITTSEMAEELGVSKSYSYKLLRQLNTELESRGYITFSGKVSRSFFEEKFHGMSEDGAISPPM